MYDKKTIVLIVILLLSIVLNIIFVWAYFERKSNTDTSLGEIRGQQAELARSAQVSEQQLKLSLKELRRIEDSYRKLRNGNRELTAIIKNLADRNIKTEGLINEYGIINRKFRDFLQQETVTD